MLTHVLDTSAWLAHIFREPGWQVVTELFLDPAADVGISAVSLVEVNSRIKAVRAGYRYTEVMAGYKELFTNIVAADEAVANRAIDIRQAAIGRVPSMDALIAATAAHHNAVLVHRDPHFRTIPAGQLRQLVLDAPQ